MKPYKVTIWCPNCFCVNKVEMLALQDLKTLTECPVCLAAHIWKLRRRHPAVIESEEQIKDLEGG